MNKDLKLCLLLVPLIFMVLLCVPAMIEVIGSEFMQERPEGIWILHLVMLIISTLIWFATFYHIPLGVYIAMLIVYTIVSWTWILRQKKGNAVYAIVWILLCVLSILMYWEWGYLYGSVMYI